MIKKILTYLLPALKLTLVLIILCSLLYPLLITGIAKVSPGGGEGATVSYKGKVVGYENIGQKFTDDKYFWSRPSAVNYNASGSGASNKSPSNPDLIKDVQSRIDTFLVHNPGIKKEQIPIDLITASGSGLDPDISLQGAKVQVPRIARIRNMKEEEIYSLIDKIKEGPLLGFLGPEKVNVLKLNIALNNK
jgi:K+-transporting ATPase ATPase C chain